MRGLGITHKQRRYAQNLMNTDLSRRQALQQAGYSESMSNKPMKVENSNGFKLAMAGIFAQSGNVSMAILNEMDAQIGAGKLKELEIGKLVNYFDTMTRAMERIAPKDISSTNDDVSRIFAGVVGTGSQDSQSQDNTSDAMSSDTVDNGVDLTSIVKDSIVNDIVDNDIASQSIASNSDVLHNETSEQSSNIA